MTRQGKIHSDLIWHRFRAKPLDWFKIFKRRHLTIRMEKGYVMEIQLRDMYSDQPRCSICDSRWLVRKRFTEDGMRLICDRCKKKFNIEEIE